MRKQVTCPFCGYRMPVEYTAGARCKGVFVRCKGRGCKKEFEVVIPSKQESESK